MTQICPIGDVEPRSGPLAVAVLGFTGVLQYSIPAWIRVRVSANEHPMTIEREQAVRRLTLVRSRLQGESLMLCRDERKRQEVECETRSERVVKRPKGLNQDVTEQQQTQ